MRLIGRISLSISLLMFFQQCEYVEILHKDPVIIVSEIMLDDFEEVTVEIPIELMLVQNNDQLAVIEGPDYKVSNLSMIVEGNVLIIDRKEFIYERKDQVLKITLPVQNLSRITLNNPTILSNKDVLNFNKFSLVVNGPGTYSESNLHLNCTSVYIGAYGKNSGDHVLRGSTKELSLRLEGLAWTDASQLKASKVRITQRSMKSSYVHATDQLSIRMYSEGHVYYTGNPELDFEIVQPDWNANFGRAIQQDR